MKTAISLPDNLYAIADKYASEHNLSRSALIAAALAEYLEAHRRDGLISQINEAVSSIGDDVDPVLTQKSKRLLRENEW